MVKRFLLLGLLVLAFTGASSVISFAGGPVCPPAMAPPPGPPCPPPICGPAKTSYSIVKEVITPIPAQLRRVRVVAPYLAGIAWPRTPLAFYGNLQSFPNPIAPGRYEWLVPVVEVKKEHFWEAVGPCCAKTKVPRCVYVKANYVRMPCAPVPVAPPPPMPMKVAK
jgi:hypothetical protein